MVGAEALCDVLFGNDIAFFVSAKSVSNPNLCTLLHSLAMDICGLCSFNETEFAGFQVAIAYKRLIQSLPWSSCGCICRRGFKV